jgi:hypothetical protein
MKTLAFVLRYHALRLLFGIGMLVCAISFYRAYVPTPESVPFESVGDMVHPWFEIVAGAVGLWCVVTAWLKGRAALLGLR